jgi:hypothetical protein
MIQKRNVFLGLIGIMLIPNGLYGLFEGAIAVADPNVRTARSNLTAKINDANALKKKYGSFVSQSFMTELNNGIAVATPYQAGLSVNNINNQSQTLQNQINDFVRNALTAFIPAAQKTINDFQKDTVIVTLTAQTTNVQNALKTLQTAITAAQTAQANPTADQRGPLDQLYSANGSLLGELQKAVSGLLNALIGTAGNTAKAAANNAPPKDAFKLLQDALTAANAVKSLQLNYPNYLKQKNALEQLTIANENFVPTALNAFITTAQTTINNFQKDTVVVTLTAQATALQTAITALQTAITQATQAAQTSPAAAQANPAADIATKLSALTSLYTAHSNFRGAEQTAVSSALTALIGTANVTISTVNDVSGQIQGLQAAINNAPKVKDKKSALKSLYATNNTFVAFMQAYKYTGQPQPSAQSVKAAVMPQTPPGKPLVPINFLPPAPPAK